MVEKLKSKLANDLQQELLSGSAVVFAFKVLGLVSGYLRVTLLRSILRGSPRGIFINFYHFESCGCSFSFGLRRGTGENRFKSSI